MKRITFRLEGRTPRGACPSIITAALLALTTSFADDLSQLYEKAFFLETAKGNTVEALEMYSEIISADTSDVNRPIIIQALERSLILHRRQANKTLQEKVENFSIRPSTVDRIVATFGEPDSYTAYNKVYTATNLPTSFTMSYPGDFAIHVMTGKIHELRFKQPNYSFNGIQVGTPLEEVLEKYPPKRIEDKNLLGSATPKELDVLYKNVYGTLQTHSYKLSNGLRLFFTKDKVYSMALFDPRNVSPAE